MPEVHALLAASSSHRWLHCTPSAVLESREPDTTSEAAQEGTEAHALAEKKLRSWLKTGRRSAFKAPNAEMDEYTSDYRDYVIEVFNAAKAKTPDAQLLIEQRLDFSQWVPEGFGTADAIILADKTAHVIDFKYGKGVLVNAKDNPQPKLYAAGVLGSYGLIYDIQEITVHIFQPRKNSITQATYQVSDLIKWLDEEVKPTAEKAFKGEGKCVPDDSADGYCLFCRFKNKCRERNARMIEIVNLNYPDAPQELDKKDLENLLPHLDAIAKWAKSVQDYALEQALDGVKFEGFKLVEGTSRRQILDEEKLVEALKKQGIKDDVIYQPVKVQTITNLEKGVGKKLFSAIADPYIGKPKGKPTLVPISDKRPEWVDGSVDDFDDFGK